MTWSTRAARLALAAIVPVALLAACGGDDASTTTTTTSPPETTTTAPDTTTTLPEGADPRASSYGFVKDLLTEIDAEIGEGRVFQGLQARVDEGTEVDFVGAVRQVEAVDWSQYEDDEILFVGYVYCLRYGVDETPRTAFDTALLEVARINESGDDFTQVDLATTAHIVNYASGSICGEYYLPTREFLESLAG